MTNACIGPEEPKLASCPIRQGQGGEMKMTLKALDSEVKSVVFCTAGMGIALHRFSQAGGHRALETGTSWMSQP